jgi:hypothetical protein
MLEKFHTESFKVKINKHEKGFTLFSHYDPEKNHYFTKVSQFAKVQYISVWPRLKKKLT